MPENLSDTNWKLPKFDFVSHGLHPTTLIEKEQPQSQNENQLLGA